MQTIEAEWRRVQPPDFYTTVKDATWPSFGPDDDAIELLLGDSGDPHFVRFWIDGIGDNAFREENNAERSPFIQVWTAYVVKSSKELQRQMALATYTMKQLYLGNEERNHPEYTGQNTWGLFTAQTPGVPIRWRYPRVAGGYGIGIVWGSFDVGYREAI